MAEYEKKRRLRELGGILRELLERSGLTQTELGEKLGIAQNRVSDLSRGEKPHWQKHIELSARLIELCKEYGVPPWKPQDVVPAKPPPIQAGGKKKRRVSR